MIFGCMPKQLIQFMPLSIYNIPEQENQDEGPG